MAEPRFKPSPTLVLIVEERLLSRGFQAGGTWALTSVAISMFLLPKPQMQGNLWLIFTLTLQGKKNSKLS